MKVAILTAISVLGTNLHAGAVADIPDAIAKQLVKDGSADPAKAAIAHREAEGEKIITVSEPPAEVAPAPDTDAKPKG